MTEQNKLPPRESRKNLTSSVLERKLIQGTVGSNLIKTNPFDYGKIGLNSAEVAYDSIMSSEEMKKEKEEAYKSKKEEYKRLGVAGEPSYPTDSDSSYELMQGLEETMKYSYFEDLAEEINKVAPELEIKLSDNLKGQVFDDFIKENLKDGKLDINKLSEDQREIFFTYEKLKEAYKRAVAKKIIDSNYFADLKQYFNSISGKQNSKEGE